MTCLLFPLFLLLAAAVPAEEDLDARVRAARLRVQAHVALEEWAAAERQLEKLVERFPDDRYLLADLALACQRQGKIDRAAALYQHLLERYPEERAYRQDLFYLLFEAGRYAELIELAEGASEPLAGELCQLVGESLDRTGQSGRADRLYAEALERSPDDVFLLLLLGERQLGRERPDRALLYFQRAHELHPREPRALRGLALCVRGEDPGRYRQYLLAALECDPADAETAYLLGESYLPEDRQRAIGYYREALRRLEAKARLDAYQQGLEARLLHRLGRSREAEARFRALLAARPDAADLRAGLAQLLIDEERFGEAVELLSADRTDIPAAWLRAEAHRRTGAWALLAAELAFLVERHPEDWALRLDLADALARAGQWREALRVCAALLAAPPGRRAAERAFEQRQDLLRERGTALALEGLHAGLPDEEAWELQTSLHWQLTPRLRGTARWTGGLYRDDAIPDRPDFSREMHQGSLELAYAFRPNWGTSARIDGRSHGRLGLGARTWYQPRRGGTVELEAGLSEPWTEPVDAVLYEGFLHRAALSLYTPLSARWHLQGQGAWRSFRGRGDRYFGRESRLGASLGREMLRLPYGSSFPLRSASLSGLFEATWSEQEPEMAGLIRLQEETRMLGLGLSGRFLFSGRALLDLSLFIGLDPERELGPGELYGLSSEFRADLSPRLMLYAGGTFASESSLQATGGTYHRARAGSIYYLSF
jgi:predicted Zn-dependent protease